MSYSPNSDRVYIEHMQLSFDLERHISRFIFAFELYKQ